MQICCTDLQGDKGRQGVVADGYTLSWLLGSGTCCVPLALDLVRDTTVLAGH